jgi:hypothetical protein
MSLPSSPEWSTGGCKDRDLSRALEKECLNCRDSCKLSVPSPRANVKDWKVTSHLRKLRRGQTWRKKPLIDQFGNRWSSHGMKSKIPFRSRPDMSGTQCIQTICERQRSRNHLFLAAQFGNWCVQHVSWEVTNKTSHPGSYTF